MKILIVFMILFSYQFLHAAESIDISAIADLNQRSEELWNQLIQETGSAQNAIALIKAKPEPRYKEIHDNLFQMIESFQYDNSGTWEKLKAGRLEYRYLTFSRAGEKPIHPLLRIAARNISIVAAQSIHKELGDLWDRMGNMNTTNWLFACSLARSCDQQNGSYIPEHAFGEIALHWARIYFYASKIATADHEKTADSICKFPDLRWINGSLNALMRSWMGEEGIRAEKWEFYENCHYGDPYAYKEWSEQRSFLSTKSVANWIFKDPTAADEASRIANDYFGNKK